MKLTNEAKEKIIELSNNYSNKEIGKMYLYKDAKLFLDWIYQDSTFPYLTRKYETYLKL